MLPRDRLLTDFFPDVQKDKNTRNKPIYYKYQISRSYTYSIIICFILLDDQVFLEEEPQRQEYVLGETGRIWLGTVGKFCVRPWNFSQVTNVPFCNIQTNFCEEDRDTFLDK